MGMCVCIYVYIYTINLNKLLSVRSIKNKKNESFNFTFIILSAIFFLSLCRSNFLTYIIFLFSEELLLTFLRNGKSTGLVSDIQLGNVIAVSSISSALFTLSPFSNIPIQFSHSVMSDSLRPNGLQRARLPCPSPIPGACSNWWPRPSELNCSQFINYPSGFPTCMGSHGGFSSWVSAQVDLILCIHLSVSPTWGAAVCCSHFCDLTVTGPWPFATFRHLLWPHFFYTSKKSCWFLSFLSLLFAVRTD